MSLKDRVSSLEKHATDGDSPATLVVDVEGLSREEADAKIEAAQAEYLAAHPECKNLTTLVVRSEEAKGMAERVIAGERTGRDAQ